MTKQTEHLARVRAVLATFADDVRPGEAYIALQDACVAIGGGMAIGLTMEQIKRCSTEVIDEIAQRPPR